MDEVMEQLAVAAGAGRLAPVVLTTVRENGTAEALVVLDDTGVRAAAERRRVVRGLQEDDARLIQEKAAAYALIKEQVLTVVGDGVTIRQSYPLLPVLHLQFHTARALLTTVQHPEVVGIRANERSATPRSRA